MARPRTFSDDDLLAAARQALADRGPQDFTLTDAAAAAGISRPALIQRFGNREALLRALAAREVEEIAAWLETATPGRGRGATWSFLTELAVMTEARPGPAARAGLIALEATDPELRGHALARDRLLQEAIAGRLPGDAPGGLAATLHAIVTGAVAQWVIAPEGPLSLHILQRLREVLAVFWPRQDLALPGAPGADIDAGTDQAASYQAVSDQAGG